MEDESGPARGSGGTVEPIKQATTATGRPRLTTQDPPGREYELYDPFASVKHRAKTFDEMVVKAERAQAIRFTAVDGDGTRTHVHKVNGKWEVPAPLKFVPPLEMDGFVDLNKKPSRAAGEADPAPPGSAGSGKVAQLEVAARRPDLADFKVDPARDRAAEVARIQASLHERYLIKRAVVTVGALHVGQTEYRFRGDNSRVAFTESTTRLATDTNSPSVARSMVDVAQARNWNGLRISGNEDFRRLVWLEASVRGVKTVGYKPVPGDMERLRKEREARQVNRVEPLPDRKDGAGAVSQPATAAAKQSARGSGGRKAVLAALEAVLVDRKVPERQREAVMAAAAENLAKRSAAGETHRVKVYDKAASPQRSQAMPTPEVQRSRDWTQPAPVR